MLRTRSLRKSIFSFTRPISTYIKSSTEHIKDGNKLLEKRNDILAEGQFRIAASLGNQYGNLYAGRLHNIVTKNLNARNNYYLLTNLNSGTDPKLQYDLSNFYQESGDAFNTLKLLRMSARNGGDYAAEKLKRLEKGVIKYDTDGNVDELFKSLMESRCMTSVVYLTQMVKNHSKEELKTLYKSLGQRGDLLDMYDTGCFFEHIGENRLARTYFQQSQLYGHRYGKYKLKML